MVVGISLIMRDMETEFLSSSVRSTTGGGGAVFGFLTTRLRTTLFFFGLGTIG